MPSGRGNPSTSEQRAEPGPDDWRKLAAMSAAAGLIFVALYVSAYLVLKDDAVVTLEDGEVVTHLEARRTLTIAGMYLIPLAGIAMLYFSVFVRRLAWSTGKPVSRVLANLHLLTGAIFVALVLTAAAASTSAAANLRFASADVDPLFARQLPLFATTLLVGFALRMAAMFVFTSSTMGKACGLLPGWFSYLGYAVGLLLLLAYSVSSWLALVFPAWVASFCILLVVRLLRTRPGAEQA
jgi:hypothetical protein